ncbi:CD70 antigen [Cricetulus griseus]
MQHRPAGVAEEGRPCPWVLPRPGWATVLRFSCLLLLGIVICCLIFCSQLWRQKQTQLKPIKVRAEKGKEGREALRYSGGDRTGSGRMHLKDVQERNPGHGKRGKIGTKWVEKRKMKQTENGEAEQGSQAGPRKDPTLRWAAGPALGRSFTHGPGLEKGQLYIHREGIYRLHIQVTLANCSSAYSTIQHRATVAVGICSPAAHSISLLRLPFGQSCTVASQRLTHLAVGDVLCTNLTLPLLPSRNSEETFFGIHWVYP